ncbi:MAG: TIM barrel protein [Thermoguttaceae bacterium]
MFKNFNPSALGISGHQSEMIELALTFGFGGMDLSMTEFAARARIKGLPYAKRLIESSKIRIGTFPLPMAWDTDDATFKDDLKKLPEYAGYAKELGCTRCTAVLAPVDSVRPYHENFEFHRHRFQDICQTLQSAGVRLAVGFQGAEYLRRDKGLEFVHDLDAANLLVNAVAAPNAGLLLDIWDVVAAGGSLESVRKLSAQQIVAVQVADMPAGVAAADLDEKSRLLPGGESSQIDVAAFLALLQEWGYDGPVTVKPSRAAFQSRRRDIVVKQTAESLGKVWPAAGLSAATRSASAPAD